MLLETLCAEVERLLCSDDVSEEEKVRRITLAHKLIAEQGE